LHPPANKNSELIENVCVDTHDKVLLKKHKLNPQRKYSSFYSSIEHHDIVSGVYEGGFKLWECAIDLVKYLNNIKANKQSTGDCVNFQDAKVLELGCGHGLPGIYALQQGATVHFQDYNEEVLTELTIPNVFSNMGAHLEDTRSRAHFFAGDWDEVNDLLAKEESTYDVILSADTLYNQNSHKKLYNVIASRLKPKTGIALIAAKSYYFGCGGGVQTFLDIVSSENDLSAKRVHFIEDGSSNTREIIQLGWKSLND